jgi:ABC-type iron transport system FetAB permease component
MSKLLLLSTVIAIVVIPIFASRSRTTQKGMKLAVWGFLAFNAFYVVAVLGFLLRLSWKMSPGNAIPDFFVR